MSKETCMIPQWSECSKCGKYFEEKIAMKVGDKVNFTNVVRRGDNISFNAVSGKIDEIGKVKIAITYRKKRIIKRIDEVSSPKSKNGLTVSVGGACECKDPKPCI